MHFFFVVVALVLAVAISFLAGMNMATYDRHPSRASIMLVLCALVLLFFTTLMTYSLGASHYLWPMCSKFVLSTP